ncbi:MAG: TonB family protein [Planctomycetes bacterium]|nr:TonB family protein [Planctomycetota bacterium]
MDRVFIFSLGVSILFIIGAARLVNNLLPTGTFHSLVLTDAIAMPMQVSIGGFGLHAVALPLKTDPEIHEKRIADFEKNTVELERPTATADDVSVAASFVEPPRRMPEPAGRETSTPELSKETARPERAPSALDSEPESSVPFVMSMLQTLPEPARPAIASPFPQPEEAEIHFAALPQPAVPTDLRGSALLPASDPAPTPDALLRDIPVYSITMPQARSNQPQRRISHARPLPPGGVPEERELDDASAPVATPTGRTGGTSVMREVRLGDFRIEDATAAAGFDPRESYIASAVGPERIPASAQQRIESLPAELPKLARERARRAEPANVPAAGPGGASNLDMPGRRLPPTDAFGQAADAAISRPAAPVGVIQIVPLSTLVIAERGMVAVSVMINPQGQAESARVARSCGRDALDEAARTAALHTTYTAAMENGVPVAAEIVVEVPF